MTANVLPDLLDFDILCEFIVGSAKHNNGARSVTGNTVKCRTPLSSGSRSPSKPLIYCSWCPYCFELVYVSICQFITLALPARYLSKIKAKALIFGQLLVYAVKHQKLELQFFISNLYIFLYISNLFGYTESEI